MLSTIRALRACGQLLLPSALSLVVGCSFEDHPSLGRYEPLPAQPSTPAGDDDGHAGDSAATASGGKGAASFIPTLDGGTSDAAAIAADAADAADPGSTPIADSGAIDASVIAEPRCDGVYAGVFKCTVRPPLIDPLTTNEIQVKLTLQQAPGAALATATADLVFSFEGYLFDGTISGQLDCATTAFHANVTDGLLASDVTPIPVPFTGMIDGELDRTSRSLAGSWSFTPENGDTCIGNWNAQLQP